MPDITMCADETCPIKNECYRYRAYPSKYRQSYFADPMYNHEIDLCDYKMTIWDSDNVMPIKPDFDTPTDHGMAEL